MTPQNRKAVYLWTRTTESGAFVNENNSAGNGSIISKTFAQRIGSTLKQGHAPAAFAVLLRLLHCYVMRQPSDVHQTR